MSTRVSTLPAPVRFTLPDGWVAVPPREVKADNAAFVAVYPEMKGVFTPNITVTGHVRPHYASLEQVAEQALAELRSGASDVQVGERSEIGNASHPGFVRAVRFALPYGGKPLYIVQRQAFFRMRHPRSSAHMAVLQVVLTALPEQFVNLLDEFHDFLSTIRPEVVQ